MPRNYRKHNKMTDRYMIPGFPMLEDLSEGSKTLWPILYIQDESPSNTLLFFLQ